MALALWCITAPLWLVLCRDGWSESGQGRRLLRAMCFGLYFFCELVSILVAEAWVLTWGMLVGKLVLSDFMHFNVGESDFVPGSFDCFPCPSMWKAVCGRRPYVLCHSSSADTILAADVGQSPATPVSHVLKQTSEPVWILLGVDCNVFVNRQAARST